MLPDMTALLRKFPFMFPDTVSVQELGEATLNDSGASIPPTWGDVSGLTALPALIESRILRRSNEGEILSTEGEVSVSTFNILFDRVHDGINERQRLLDQNGKYYQITDVARDDHAVSTIVTAKEIKP